MCNISMCTFPQFLVSLVFGKYWKSFWKWHTCCWQLKQNMFDHSDFHFLQAYNFVTEIGFHEQAAFVNAGRWIDWLFGRDEIVNTSVVGQYINQTCSSRRTLCFGIFYKNRYALSTSHAVSSLTVSAVWADKSDSGCSASLTTRFFFFIF